MAGPFVAAIKGRFGFPFQISGLKGVLSKKKLKSQTALWELSWTFLCLEGIVNFLIAFFVFFGLNLKASLIISAMAFVRSEYFESILYKHRDLLNRGNLLGPSLS